MWPWPRSPLSNSLLIPRFSAPAATRSGRGFFMRKWRRVGESAFPFGAGGRAQRGRMRSSPWRTANPAGWGRSFGAVRTCRFQRGRTSSPARKLWCLPLGLREPAVPIAGCCAAARELAFSFPFLMFCCVAPGLPPEPAQGLTPPLHPRKGFHPLTLFRWRVPLEYAKGGSAAFAAEPPQSFIQ